MYIHDTHNVNDSYVVRTWTDMWTRPRASQVDSRVRIFPREIFHISNLHARHFTAIGGVPLSLASVNSSIFEINDFFEESIHVAIT